MQVRRQGHTHLKQVIKDATIVKYSVCHINGMLRALVHVVEMKAPFAVFSHSVPGLP